MGKEYWDLGLEATGHWPPLFFLPGVPPPQLMTYVSVDPTGLRCTPSLKMDMSLPGFQKKVQ